MSPVTFLVAIVPITLSGASWSASVLLGISDVVSALKNVPFVVVTKSSVLTPN